MFANGLSAGCLVLINFCYSRLCNTVVHINVYVFLVLFLVLYFFQEHFVRAFTGVTPARYYT